MLRTAIAPLAALCFLAFAAPPADAANSFHGDGVTLRLVAVPPGADGKLRAALRIDLDPGWKTYWLDPGEAGVPPSLDFGRSQGVTGPKPLFPAPQRFKEADGIASIGYRAPFSVAIEGGAVPSGILDVRVTLGLCRELCVPVAAELTLDLAKAGDEDAVAAAFAALPRPSGPTEGITGFRLSPDAKALEVEVRSPALAEKGDLFATAPGWAFGAPVAHADGQMAVPVLRKPRKGGTPTTIEAVLVGPDGAFRATGTIAVGGG